MFLPDLLRAMRAIDPDRLPCPHSAAASNSRRCWHISQHRIPSLLSKPLRHPASQNKSSSIQQRRQSRRSICSLRSSFFLAVTNVVVNVLLRYQFNSNGHLFREHFLSLEEFVCVRCCSLRHYFRKLHACSNDRF